MNSGNHSILLVSPAPVDGYPPVQYQARIIAKAGYNVVLLTSCMPNTNKVLFKCGGVEIYGYSLSSPRWFRRNFEKIIYFANLIKLRCRLHPICELTYDPIGLFFTRICPFKPATIIGHLHEALFNPKTIFYEKSAVEFLKKLSLVVVADQRRADLLVDQAGLTDAPMVVRNLPLPTAGQATCSMDISDSGANLFSVVYHGSVGYAQALDSVIRSMVSWPAGVKFHIYGSPTLAIKQDLECIANEFNVADRLVFEGWVESNQILSVLRRYTIGISLLRPLNDNWRFSLGASNKRYQYMQAGLPQISDDAVDVRQFLEGNQVGVCVSPDDPAAIADAVNFFYENPCLCEEYGRRASEMVESELNYDREFQPVMNFIKEKTLSQNI